MTPPPLNFTEADVDAANVAWGLNCGPAALAAICGLTLDQVRPLIPEFETRRYTSPTMMRAGVAAAGYQVGTDDRNGTRDPHCFPPFGLVRIQFEGPWYGRWAYQHTHWVASRVWQGGMWVFDVNCGWQTARIWAGVPRILTAEIRRATGGWHATHRWGLARAGEEAHAGNHR